MTTLILFFFQSLTEDVNRQTEREKSLQNRYAELQEKIKQMQQQMEQVHQEMYQQQVAPSEPEMEQTSLQNQDIQ